MTKKAFTLIELLVVIAIIAILAAILFPVFAQAKNAAKKTAGISNAKQLLLASQMYLNDSDDVYHLIRATVPTGNPLNWAYGSEDMLQPYMKNWDIHGDPGDGVARDDCSDPFGSKISFSWTHYRQDGSVDDRRTFGLHAYNHPTWTPAQARSSLSASSVGSPAATINLYPLWTTASYTNGYAYYRWYTDEIGATFGPIPTYPQALSFTWCSASPGAGRMAIGSYSGQSTFGFADGHVKSMQRAQIMHQRQGSWMWNQDDIDNNRRNLLHYDERFKN
jgi:prepilin-type N-terminal cleavage/methylation domain-containing protein/prepilin-type processing-associated H-X9-DG protein